MAVLKSLMHALHQSKSFQTELQAQLQQYDPNLGVLSSCCLKSITDHQDFTTITGQLLDNSVQARTYSAMSCDNECVSDTQ